MHDGHEAGANGLEDGFNLWKEIWSARMVFFLCFLVDRCGVGGSDDLTHDTTAPILRVTRVTFLKTEESCGD